jgi:hypothetical protein
MNGRVFLDYLHVIYIRFSSEERQEGDGGGERGGGRRWRREKEREI